MGATACAPPRTSLEAVTWGLPYPLLAGRVACRSPAFLHDRILSEAAMMAVIFEVRPHESQRQTYLELAGALRPLLEGSEGFVSIERFESLTEPGKILSLSFWRDEGAVQAWRQVEAHRAAQVQGRGGVFQDYRLRVAEVVRDYGMNERNQAPTDCRRVHG